MQKSFSISGREIRYMHEQDELLLPPNELFTIKITYPISDTYKVPFTTPAEGMGLGGLMRIIGKAYQNIYENADDFGVWGHGIGDLVLERVNVDFDTKTITLGVGS